MATSLASSLLISAVAELTPSTPLEGAVKATLNNGTTGERWTEGQASGQADRAYLRRARALGGTATDTYNVLAAGSLEDLLGQAIDLDEMKVLVVEVISGTLEFRASAADFLPIFKAASNGLSLAAGDMVAVSLGAAGRTIGTGGTFEVYALTDCVYDIYFTGAN